MYLKLLKYIGICLICGFTSFVLTSFLKANVPTVSALTKTDYRSNLSQLISVQSEVKFRTLDFSDLKFTKTKDTNLYLILYNEFVDKSRDSGIKILANLTGESPSNIANLVDNYDTSFLQNKKDSTPTEVATRANELITLYQQEQSLFSTLAVLEGQTLAFELFANGKKRDSSFDLVEDLNELEKVLLGRNSDSQFSGSLNQDRSGAEVLAGSTLSLTQNAGNPPTSSAANPDSDNAPAADASTPDEELSANALTCPIDQSLAQDLNQFNQASNLTGAPLSPEQQEEQNDRNQAINKIAQGGTPDLTPLVNDINKCDIPNDFTGVKFCLKTERVYATARSYFPADQNCIACRIQNLANITEELASGSLIPKKVTGNFGEPNLCKKALFNAFSLQINFVPKPARPDLEIVDSITDISASDITAQVQSTSIQLDESDSFEAVAGVSQGLVSATQTQASPNEILANEVETINIEAATSASINSTSEFVSSIIDRLTTMNLYFSNYKTYLAEIQSDLIELQSKPQCSAL